MKEIKPNKLTQMCRISLTLLQKIGRPPTDLSVSLSQRKHDLQSSAYK